MEERGGDAASIASAHAGWHRKWLLLCAVLVWVYFLRFRLLGWLVSQALTLALRVKMPRLRARAQIQYITRRPLVIGHMEIRCAENDWRFVCTRVVVATHVLAFFRSFMQKKILVVVVEDVYMDLVHLDEELVRDLVSQSEAIHVKPAKESVRANASSMGFMRFIDVQVRNVRISVDAFETRSLFRCSDLCVNIPDVIVPLNVLHLSITVSSLFASSRRLRSRVSVRDARQSFTQRDSAMHDKPQNEISCELTNLNAVLDIRLTDQIVVGCNLESSSNEPALILVSTAYVEYLLMKKLDLVRRNLLPIPKWIWRANDAGGTAGNGSLTSPFTIQVTDFPVLIDLTHDHPSGVDVSFHVSTRVRELKYSRGESADSETTNSDRGTSPSMSAPTRAGVRMSLDCQQIVISDRDSAHEVSSMTWCRVELSRDDLGRGFTQCRIEELRLAVNPVVCQAIHSLVLFPDVVDDFERQTVQLMLEQVARRQKRPVFVPKRRVPVHWNIDVELDSWSLRSWLLPGHGNVSADLEASGKKASLKSVIPPKKSTLKIKHSVSLTEVNATILQLPKNFEDRASEADYTIQFADLSILASKVLSPSPSTKSMEVKLSSSSVSVNGHTNGTTPQPCVFPRLLLSNLSFELSGTESNDQRHVSITVSASDADVVACYPRHKKSMSELGYVVRVLDQVRLMLTPPELEDGNVKAAVDAAAISMTVRVLASSSHVQLLDIEGISSSVEFNANKTNVVHQKGKDGVTNSVNCAFLNMMWFKHIRVFEATGVRFDQVVDSRHDDLSPHQDPASRCEISLSQLQLWLEPKYRLLLLILKLNELVNVEEVETSHSTKKSIRQVIDVSCNTVGIQVRETSLDALQVLHDINLDRLVVHANMTKSNQITDAVVRYLQVTQRDESCRSCLTDCIQVVGAEGYVGCHSLAVISAGHDVFSLNELLVNFAVTDVVGSKCSRQIDQLSSHYIPPRFVIFDISTVGQELKVKISRDATYAAKAILPVLQDAFDSRSDSTIADTTDDQASDWRLRYVGALDCAFEHVIITSPIPGDVFQSGSAVYYDKTDCFLIFRAHQIAIKSRQLHKMTLQFEVFRIVLSDHGEDEGFGEASNRRAVCEDEGLPLQLLVLPRAKLDAVVHWRNSATGSTTRASSDTQQFAVSLDLVLRRDSTISFDQVPIADETLVSLNWDYVFPLLVFLLTEDEYEHDDGMPASVDAAAVSDIAIPASKTAFECVGVQWNVSIDALQLAWWDAMTQESAVLIVCHDFLSHGVAKLYHEGGKTPSSEPAWVLWETTIYLDLFRAYILREAEPENEFIALACGALPFESNPPSRFFFETTGTSYRVTHRLSGEEVAESDGGSGHLFGDFGFAIADKLHDEFEHVACSFGGGTMGGRPHRMESTSSPSLGSSGNISPPRSPRAWTQSVRAKLARLKRRTTSMDNLLVNDGSRPIQIDSMKLLWTIETRDCAFNMIAVISDSVAIILEASVQCREQRGGVRVQPIGHVCAPNDVIGSPSISMAKPTRMEELRGDSARGIRRVSTRDSLLELLHQGKLGMKDSSTLCGDGEPSTGDHSHGESSRAQNEELHLSKLITNKLYTLDVHDAQINILEEASRSSALIASKHIHLEIGSDDSSTTTITTLKFESVTGHVAPLDVEVSSGVLWYPYHRGPAQFASSPRSSTSNTSLLKQVMEEFSLEATYSQAISTGATSVEVDMSSLQLSTDRHQFYQLLDVLRHVLLAPPTVLRRMKRQLANRRDAPSEAVATFADDISVFPPTILPSVPTYTGKKLHAQLVEEMRLRDSKMLATNRSSQVLLKVISFRSAGCVYRLRTSPESTGGDHEFIEIRAEGINGSHMYFLSQSTKLVLNLQWMEINNLRPGSTSIAFEDPMAVLKAKLLVDQKYQTSKRVMLSNQKGMLTVRAESGPQTRVLGQKLRILDVLEVSIFPEIPNMIVIQLAADFYELLYKYFFEQINTNEHQETHHAESVLFGKKGSISSVSSIGGPSIAGVAPQSPVTKSRAYTSPSSPRHHITVRRKSIQISSAVGSTSTETSLSISTATSPSAEPTADDDDSTPDGHELFYFKYVRVGSVRLRINCNGFFVNLNNFDLDLPPYVCQSKLCTWKKLLQKFESHLKWHVTKESASTGLSHFKNKLLKWTPTSSDKKEKEKQKKDEDTATMNAQLLFGPYSGTP